MALDNSIVVQNRSSATECDENIYNSLFYNAFEIEGETYAFEEPVPALIDGSNNLSTFVWWVSTFDFDNPTSTGTNALYNESIPLFEQDPDIDEGTAGDYALYVSDQSRAIDRGDSSLARYRNGKAFSYDLAGKKRVISASVDIGAFESGVKPTDVSVSDVETVSSSAIVVGGALGVDGIAVVNEGSNESEEITLRFYATVSGTIDEQAILLSTVECGRLAPGDVAVVSSGILPTSALTPGQTYRIAWKIVCENDTNDGND